MNSKISLALISFIISLSACNKEKHLTVENKSCQDVENGAIIITNNELGIDIDSKLIPVIIDENNKYIASQYDSICGVKELSFILDVKSKEKRNLKIKFISKDELPEHKISTNIRYARLVNDRLKVLSSDTCYKYNLPRGGENYPYQHDGPAWENDKVGFRLYFDGRNCIDIYGKLTDKLVLDNVGLNKFERPFNNYQTISWWGKDILNCGGSFGIGGIAAIKNDSIIRLGVTVNETTNNIEQTVFNKIIEGPVRSMFRIDYKGWNVNGTYINLQQYVTIWKGQYGFDVKIKSDNITDNIKLMTGIVNNFNTKDYIIEKKNNNIILSTYDKQTANRDEYLGMAISLDTIYYNKNFNSPDKGKVTTTWCTELKLDNNNSCEYSCYAGWENSNDKFKDRQGLIEEIKKYSTNNLSITIK